LNHQMFKITIVKKEDAQNVADYLEYKSKGITLACYEEGEITGAVCFDIIQGNGYVQKVKTNDPNMKIVVGKAALNFLELHNIYNVYVNDENDMEYFKTLGFKDTGNYPQELGGSYVAYLNLEGYFDAHVH